MIGDEKLPKVLDLGEYAARRAISDCAAWIVALHAARRQLQFADLACKTGYPERVIQHIGLYQAESVKAARSWRDYLYFTAQSERCRRRGWRGKKEAIVTV